MSRGSKTAPHSEAEKYKNDQRKFDALVDCLECVREEYAEDLLDPFMRIVDAYDPTNLEHVQSAENFLHFCKNNIYTTHIIVPDPLLPYPIKVRFELRNGEIIRTVLEDSLGRVIPKTFKYVDRSWGENGINIVARYSSVINSANHLAVLVEFLGIDNANIGERTKTAGVVARFTNEMRTLAKEENAEKLFIQFDPANKRLGALAKKRYQYHEAEINHNNYTTASPDFEGESYCTLEIDLKEPALTPEQAFLKSLPRFPCCREVDADVASVATLSTQDVRDLQSVRIARNTSGLSAYQQQTLMFIIKPTGELILTEQLYGHEQLGNGQEMLAAGDVHLIEGEDGVMHIDSINNRSGAYMQDAYLMPDYVEKTRHLPELVEKIFIKSGFLEVKGKYREHKTKEQWIESHAWLFEKTPEAFEEWANDTLKIASADPTDRLFVQKTVDQARRIFEKNRVLESQKKPLPESAGFNNDAFTMRPEDLREPPKPSAHSTAAESAKPFFEVPNYSAVPYSEAHILAWQKAEYFNARGESARLIYELENRAMSKSERARVVARVVEIHDFSCEMKRWNAEKPTHFFNRNFLDGKLYAPTETVFSMEGLHIPGEPTVTESLKRMGVGVVNLARGLLPAIAAEGASRVAGWMSEAFEIGEGATDATKAASATAATGIMATALRFTPAGRFIYMAMVGTSHVADILNKYERLLITPSLPDSHPANAGVHATVALGQMFNGVFRVGFSAVIGAADGVGEWALNRGDHSLASHIVLGAASHSETSFYDFIYNSEKFFKAIYMGSKHVLFGPDENVNVSFHELRKHSHPRRLGFSFTGSAHAAEMPDQTSTSTRGDTSMRASDVTSSTNPIMDFFKSVYADIRSMQNPAAPQTAYDQARLAETFSAYRRTAGAAFNPRSFHTSKNERLKQLAHYIASPQSFSDNAHQISTRTLAFINSDSPDAAAFTEQTLCRYQFEFLNEMSRYSEKSLEHAFDRVTELMNKENVPQDARSFYYQQALSALPIKNDLTVDQITFNQKHAELKQHYDVISKQVGILQKDADKHHAQFSASMKKLTGAVNQNAADIAALKEGQQEIAAFLNNQKIEADKLLKAQQEIDGYQKCGQFLGMAGDVFKEPILKKAGTVCMAGVMAYQAYNGFATLAATTAAEAVAATAAVAAGETVAASSITLGATLNPYAMAGMAALMMLNLILDDDEPQEDPRHQQIMQMLQQIMEKLNEIQKQMHERFDLLDKRLDKTTELMLQGFDAVLADAKIIITHHLQSHYAAEKLAAKVDSVASDMHAGFEAIQDTLIKPIMSGILKPSSKDALKKLSEGEISRRKERLFFFLTGTSCLPAANGYHRISDDGAVVIRHDVIAKVLHDQSEASIKTTSAPHASTFHQLALPDYYHQSTLTIFDIEKQIALDIFTSAYPDYDLDLMTNDPDNWLQHDLYSKENQIYVLDRPVDLNTLKPGYYVRILTLPDNKFHVYGVEVLSTGNILVHENIPQVKFSDHYDHEFKDQLIALNNQSKVIFRTAKTKEGGLVLHQDLAQEYVAKGKVALFQSSFQTTASKINISMPKLYNLLGLLAGLANYHVGSHAISVQPESLLSPSQWRPAIVAYEKLLTECNSALGLDKASHIEEIHELSGRLEKLQTFLHKVSLNKPLFEKLVGNYHESLSDIKKLIIAHLEKQEIEYYQKSGIQVSPGEHLIRLDETFDEASANQVDSYFQECNERAPVHFNGHSHGLSIYRGDEYLAPNATFTEDSHVQERYPNRGCGGGSCDAQGHCTCTFYDASQAAWDQLKRHHQETVKPAIERMQLAKTEKQLSLGLRLQHIRIERSLTMSFVPDQSRAGAHIAHSFQNKIGLKGEDANIFMSGMSNYFDENGDHQNYIGMFMTQHLYRSNCYGGGEWAITTIDKKELEALSKKISPRVHQLLKSYRDQAITELLSDVQFTKALEQLESSALQIHAFANLMCIIPTEWVEKPLRAEWIKEKLAEILRANPDQSISMLQGFLKKLCDRKALEASDLLGATPCDITRNPLYKWAQDTVTDLRELELKVNAWTDARAPQAESTDTTLLHEEIRELRKEIAALAVTKVSHQAAPSDNDGEITDDDDDFLLEEKTSQSFSDKHIARPKPDDESLWEKPKDGTPGQRVLPCRYFTARGHRAAFFTHLERERKVGSVDYILGADRRNPEAIIVQLKTL